MTITGAGNEAVRRADADSRPDDRRTSVRLPVVIPAEARVEDEPAWREIEIIDISVTGVAVLARELWGVGTRLRLRYTLPTRHDGVDIDAIGLVVGRMAPKDEDEMVLGAPRYRYGVSVRGLTSAQERCIMATILWAQSRRDHRREVAG